MLPILEKNEMIDKILNYMAREKYRTVYLVLSNDRCRAAKYCRSINQPYVFNTPSILIDEVERDCNRFSNYKAIYYRDGDRRPYILSLLPLVPFEQRSVGDYLYNFTILGK